MTVIERGALGGNCVWHGCVPKKALYTAAQTRLAATEAARMGFSPGPPDLDWARLMAWRQEVQQTYAGDQEGILTGLGVTVVHGESRFVSPSEVLAGDRVFSAHHIVVSTGSRASRPPIPGAELMDTSDDALQYPERPSSLVIVGGGYIAMEFAGIYAALGVEVTVVLRGKDVLKPFEPEAAAVARRGLESLGVRFVEEARLEAVEGLPGELRVALALPEGPRELRAARVLAATGRRPDLGGLDLAAGGVDVDEHGRPMLDRFLRSRSNPRVWVAGDAAGGVELTPVASLEGEALARSIVDGEPVEPDLALVPSTCFTVPEVARVGLGEAELAARGRPYQVARGDFEYVAQAIIAGRRDGLVKLLAERGRPPRGRTPRRSARRRARLHARGGGPRRRDPGGPAGRPGRPPIPERGAELGGVLGTDRHAVSRVAKSPAPEKGMGRDDWGAVVAAHMGPAAPGRRR